jgi:hypothetical protein
MAIDLHIPIHPSLTLVTCDCQLSESHKGSTPRFSYPDLTNPHRASDPTPPAPPVPAQNPAQAPAPTRPSQPAPGPPQYPQYGLFGQPPPGAPPPFGQPPPPASLGPQYPQFGPGPPSGGQLQSAALAGQQYPQFSLGPPSGGQLQSVALPGHQYPSFGQPAQPSAPQGSQYPPFGPPAPPAGGGLSSLSVPAQLYSPPAQLYSPPACHVGGHSGLGSASQRSLSTAFAGALAPVPVAVCQSDPMLATILTDQGRSEASQDFLNCCRLIVHHDPAVVLTDPNTGPLALHSSIFPRQPREHFRRDVLGPLFTASSLQGYMASFYNYVEALLSRTGVLLSRPMPRPFSPPSELESSSR